MRNFNVIGQIEKATSKFEFYGRFFWTTRYLNFATFIAPFFVAETNKKIKLI